MFKRGGGAMVLIPVAMLLLGLLMALVGPHFIKQAPTGHQWGRAYEQQNNDARNLPY